MTCAWYDWSGDIQSGEHMDVCGEPAVALVDPHVFLCNAHYERWIA